MMTGKTKHWMTTPTPLNVPGYLSKGTTSKVSKLNAELDAIHESRHQIEANYSALEQANVASVDVDDLMQADTPRHVRFAVLQRELRWHQDALAVIPDIERDRKQALQQAFEALQAKRQEVREGLVKLGFIDCHPTEYFQNEGNTDRRNLLRAARIMPGTVEASLPVAELRARHDSLRADWLPRKQAHRQCIDLITKQLHNLRNKAMAA